MSGRGHKPAAGGAAVPAGGAEIRASAPPSLPLLPEPQALEAAARVGVPDLLAQLNIFRLLLRREPQAKALSDLLLSLMAHAELDARLRELAIMRIGWVTGSAYEWAQHWRIARDLGVAASELVGVRDWEHCETFGNTERTVLAAVDECLTTKSVSSATMASLSHHLGTDAAIDLVLCIGAWSMVAVVLRSLRVPLETGVEAWPPDGRGPQGHWGP